MTDVTHPVVELAKERKQNIAPNEFKVDGVTICMRGVPSGTVQDAMAKVKPPPVPTWYNEDKGREEENPNDPSYLQALEDLKSEKALAATEAVIMFGMDIDQGTWPPENDVWLKKLKLAHKRGLLDLSWVDWDDMIDQQFLFLKHRAMTNERYLQLSAMSGMNQEAMVEAIASFRRAQAGNTDRTGDAQE